MSKLKRNTTHVSFEAYYEIDILDIFKGKDKFKNMTNLGEFGKTDNAFIFTSPYDSTCGVTLDYGGDYFLSGEIWNNNLRIALCDLHGKWEDIREKLKGIVLKSVVSEYSTSNGAGSRARIIYSCDVLLFFVSFILLYYA